MGQCHILKVQIVGKLVIYFDKKKKRYDTKISLTEEEWEKINAPKLRDVTLKPILLFDNTINQHIN